jgi:alkylation response protein AidB-like acyl-CoA dehydrogenase
VKLVLDAEQEDLRATVRRLLTDRSAPAAVREVMAGDRGDDPALWKSLAELGVLGLVVPEELGGAGAGHVERAVVLEELGRALTPSPFLASAVLATDVLLALDDDPLRTELLAALVAGDKVGAVVIGVTATERDGGWRLAGGSPVPTLAAAVADVLLVHTDAGWFAVDAGADGLAVKPLTSLDPTRRLAAVSFADTPARPLRSADPKAVLDLVTDLVAVALAAEQVGGMGRALELTVAYAKVRVQFGRQIGSYQGVKHGLADIYSDWEHALSIVRWAAWVADNDRAELPVAASLAQTYLGPAYFRAATGMVQYHGGIGYTWEHDAHLYYKRAKSSQLLFGPTSEHRARLADRIGV